METKYQRKSLNQKKSVIKRWWFWVITGIVAISIVFTVIIIVTPDQSVTSNAVLTEQEINIVKNGFMEIYSKTTTIGEAVDNFFDAPLWKSLEAKDGTKYVRVSGISYTEPYEGKIAITFELTETGFELFGATQNDNILEKVECPLVMEMIYSLENKVR